MKVNDIVAVIEHIAPLKLQEDYDNAGYQIGDPSAEVTGVLTCLDVTEKTIDTAIEKGANLIVSHHPLLFRPIKRITPNDYIGRVVLRAIKAGITIYSAHTNLDNAYCGVNYKIAELLGLTNVEPLAPLPPSRLADVENAEKCGSGVFGYLKETIPFDEFIKKIKTIFKTDNIRTNIKDYAYRCDCTIPIADDYSNQNIVSVALCGGSGADFISDARKKHASVFLTGEIGYHRFFGNEDIILVEAGHYETEQYTSELLKDIISAKYPNLSITVENQTNI